MNNDVDEVACLALDRERFLHDHIYEVAKLAALTAKRFSTDRTGHYDAAVFADRDQGAVAMSTFGSTDFKAWWMEFGAIRPGSVFPPRAPLRKACRALGLRLEERHH